MENLDFTGIGSISNIFSLLAMIILLTYNIVKNAQGSKRHHELINRHLQDHVIQDTKVDNNEKVLFDLKANVEVLTRLLEKHDNELGTQKKRIKNVETKVKKIKSNDKDNGKKSKI
jgi:uncharacterized protein HemX